MVLPVMILIDSSILIEYVKGNNTEILEEIFKQGKTGAINHIIYSEFIFHFFSITSGKSPLSLKRNDINKILLKHEPINFLINFKMLDMNDEIIYESYSFMKKYNLLPNDSLILATCKYYDIKYLVSLDKDFEISCQKENINLLTSKFDI